MEWKRLIQRLIKEKLKINYLQILSFYQEFIKFYRKMKEFEKDSFKNEKICKESI